MPRLAVLAAALIGIAAAGVAAWQLAGERGHDAPPPAEAPPPSAGAAEGGGAVRLCLPAAAAAEIAEGARQAELVVTAYDPPEGGGALTVSWEGGGEARRIGLFPNEPFDVGAYDPPRRFGLFPPEDAAPGPLCAEIAVEGTGGRAAFELETAR